MGRFIARASLLFAGGAIGALVNSLAVFYAGRYGLTAALGVAIAPALTPAWLYPRIVWGGLWGFVFFLLPPETGTLLTRALAASLAPTAFQLFYVFPYLAGKGLMGQQLGLLTPLAVFLFNFIWGLAAAIWIRRAGS